jgi:predicted amidohydrolase YtcJ
MENVDLLFTNAHVLTMNEQMHQFERGAVAIRGDSISAVGTEADILSGYSASKTIDCAGKVLMPGLAMPTRMCQ